MPSPQAKASLGGAFGARQAPFRIRIANHGSGIELCESPYISETRSRWASCSAAHRLRSHQGSPTAKMPPITGAVAPPQPAPL